jgi:MFS family permease
MYLYAQYYRRHELGGRWGIKAAMASVAGSFGGLLAAGLSHIPQAGILARWRWIFFVEGLVSMTLAALVWIFVPDSVPDATFLSESDRAYAVRRIESETLVQDDKEPLDRLSFRSALLNWNTQLISLATLCSLMTLTALSLFMVSNKLLSVDSVMLIMP